MQSLGEVIETEFVGDTLVPPRFRSQAGGQLDHDFRFLRNGDRHHIGRGHRQRIGHGRNERDHVAGDNRARQESGGLLPVELDCDAGGEEQLEAVGLRNTAELLAEERGGRDGGGE